MCVHAAPEFGADADRDRERDLGKLDGRVAVVTGGGRGIGRAIALAMAREGAAIVISSRTRSELDAVLAEARALGADGLGVVADAMQRDSAKEPVVQAIAHFGRIDILVNNVGGIVGMHHSLGGGDESFEATMVLNLNSAWWAASLALLHMRDHGFGRVINIGSTEALRANEGGPPAYVAGKHALVGLTRQLAQDVGHTGITVNCICPGWTNTAMVDFDRTAEALGITPAEARAYATDKAALGCILEPGEIAAMALFLASEDGARITGQAISVDGGYRL